MIEYSFKLNPFKNSYDIPSDIGEVLFSWLIKLTNLLLLYIIYKNKNVLFNMNLYKKN